MFARARARVKENRGRNERGGKGSCGQFRRAIHDPNHLSRCGPAILRYFTARNFRNVRGARSISALRARRQRQKTRQVEERENFEPKNTLENEGRLISSSPNSDTPPYVTYINHVPFVLRRKFDFIHPRPPNTGARRWRAQCRH